MVIALPTRYDGSGGQGRDGGRLEDGDDDGNATFTERSEGGDYK